MYTSVSIARTGFVGLLCTVLHRGDCLTQREVCRKIAWAFEAAAFHLYGGKSKQCETGD